MVIYEENEERAEAIVSHLIGQGYQVVVTEEQYGFMIEYYLKAA